MPKPYPREFRDDVVRVARNRDQDVLENLQSWFGGAAIAFLVGVLALGVALWNVLT